MDSPLIYDRGRGPELRRIRITVYDLIPYLESGSITDAEILGVLPITAEELAALKQYIADHYAEVMEVHRRIEERIRKEVEAQHNSPKFQALAVQSRANFELYKEWVMERKAMGLPSPRELEDSASAFREWKAQKAGTARIA